MLEEEEKLLLQLMSVVQKECFEKSKMSMEEYREAMSQYEKKLGKTIEEKGKIEINRFTIKNYKWLYFDPLIIYFAYREYIRKNKTLLQGATLVSRSVPISGALVSEGIGHIFIPPAVSKDFYQGVMNDIKNREPTSVRAFLKRVQAGVFRNLVGYFEKKVIFSPNVRVTVFSDNVKRNLEKLYPGTHNIKVVQPGIDVENFFVLPEVTKLNFRKKLGIREDDFVVLYVGRVSNGKNLKLLLDSFRHCQVENKRLVIVGDGNYPMPENEEIIKAGKQPLSKLHLYYNTANVTIIPTTHEGFGQVFIESLGCGTPVIGFDTNTTAVNEIIIDESFGIKVKHVNVSSLEQAISDMASNKQSFSEMRPLISQKAYEKFDWNNLVSDILTSSES